MRNLFILSHIVALSVSCTTLDQSMRLGASTGMIAGAAATYAAQTSAHSKASSENVTTAAAIGLGVGLIASYFIHNQVTQDRSDFSQQTEMQFGDLPPSPFVFPKPNTKKGGH